MAKYPGIAILLLCISLYAWAEMQPPAAGARKDNGLRISAERLDQTFADYKAGLPEG